MEEGEKKNGAIGVESLFLGRVGCEGNRRRGTHIGIKEREAWEAENKRTSGGRRGRGEERTREMEEKYAEVRRENVETRMDGKA